MTRGAADTALLAQARFRVLLQALANPGQVRDLGSSEVPGAAGCTPLLAVAETLLDHEVSFALLGDQAVLDNEPRFAEQVRLRTQARSVVPAAADFVFIFGSAGGDSLATLRCGSLEFPDEGATLIWRVAGFGAGGVRATLSGPGIAQEIELAVHGPPAGDLSALAAINRDYPCGLDTYFVADNGTIVGLPRSTQIAVAERSATTEAKA